MTIYLWHSPNHNTWVDWWVGSCQITKIQINLDLIEIIQFCLNIYDLWRHLHLWVDVQVVVWMHKLMGRSCHITSNQINLDLIGVIQSCLQICDLWRYLHSHTTYWSQSLAIENMSIIHSPTVWFFENWHIMHNCQLWKFFWHLTSYRANIFRRTHKKYFGYLLIS